MENSRRNGNANERSVCFLINCVWYVYIDNNEREYITVIKSQWRSFLDILNTNPTKYWLFVPLWQGRYLKVHKLNVSPFISYSDRVTASGGPMKSNSKSAAYAARIVKARRGKFAALIAKDEMFYNSLFRSAWRIRVSRCDTRGGIYRSG